MRTDIAEKRPTGTGGPGREQAGRLVSAAEHTTNRQWAQLIIASPALFLRARGAAARAREAGDLSAYRRATCNGILAGMALLALVRLAKKRTAALRARAGREV